MTTAKPKHMAGQTDSADDLIAELARLMAEDAQGDKPKSEPAVTVRIPGGESPAAVAPQPEAPARPVRIPGENASTPEPFAFSIDRRPQPPQPKAEQPQRVEPAAFAPAFSAPKPVVGEAPIAERRFVPQPAPAPTTPVDPIAIAPQEVVPPVAVFARSEPVAPAPEAMPELDQDSLADLIAAELAVEQEPAVHSQRQDDPVDELDVTDAVHGQTFPSEADAFGIPPVFGLAPNLPNKPEVRLEPAEAVVPLSKPVEANIAPQPVEPPQQSKPQALPDPLDEIERLIGPAARAQAPVAPSPALRSLATPTLPREPQPSSIVTPAQNNTRASSVEEAILAAAETSGARVEWVEPAIEARLPPEEPVKTPKAPRGRVLGLTRSLAGPLVATLLLAVAAVGLYTVLGLGGGTPEGPAPLVAADTTPTKEVPEPTPAADAASQSVVFNEISGVDTGAEEQIVSRDQSDVEAVTQVATTGDVSEEGLVNRKVRTVTVRPDGTIVSGSDSLAGSAMLPVDRPAVPEVPGADFSTPDLIANAIANAPADTPESTPAAVAPTVVPVQPGSTVPVVDLTGAPVGGKTAPVPLVRPTNLAPQAAITAPAAATPGPLAATPTPSVATAPTATLPTPAPAAVQQPQPAAVASTDSPAPAYVQLSSQRTEEAARQTAEQIASRFGSLFGGANLEVQRVDLGERGIFYRVRVPANSLQDANTICSSVKANGGDCFTL